MIEVIKKGSSLPKLKAYVICPKCKTEFVCDKEDMFTYSGIYDFLYVKCPECNSVVNEEYFYKANTCLENGVVKYKKTNQKFCF